MVAAEAAVDWVRNGWWLVEIAAAEGGGEILSTVEVVEAS